MEAQSVPIHSGPPRPQRTRPGKWTRIGRCVGVFLGHLFSNLGLFAIVVGYVLLGALLFESLEAEHELQQRGNIKQYRDDCLRELWLITERLNVLYERNWTHLVHEQLRLFEKNVVAAAKLEGYDGKDVLDSERQWSFSGALLYSVTVITTIGYGNLAPKTSAGKVLTMLYAVIGVPLMLLCLSNLGHLLAHTFQFAYSHMCCSRHRRSSKHHTHKKHIIPLSKQSSSDITIPPPEQFTRKIPPPPPPRLTPRSKPASRRPLTPEVRQLLVECAEYSVSQGDGKSDTATKRLLQDLQQEPTQISSNVDDEDDDEEDAPNVYSTGKSEFDTPSRVPLLSRSLTVSSTAASRPLSSPQSGLPVFSAPLPEPPSPHPQSPAYSSSSSSSGNSGARVPVTLVLIVLSGYICLGAAVFAAWEDWTLLDGAYFCFITLSTIGFGDLVPGKSFQRAADPQGGGQVQLVVCCAYLLLGLVLIATAFSLVQEEVIVKCRSAARRIGILSTADS